jgi:hypothetical protein
MKSAKYHLFFIVGFITFYGSSVQSRSFKVLPDMDKKECYRGVQDSLSVNVQLFTHQDCKRYFGCDLIKYGYRPLLLEISNYSDNLFILKPLFANTELVGSTEITRLIKFPVKATLSAIGIPVLYHSYKATPVVGLVGLGMWYYNQKLERELLAHTLDEESALKIVPFANVKKLVFAKEATFLSFFDINLSNETQKTTLTFHVDLLQKKRNNNNFIPCVTPW